MNDFLRNVARVQQHEQQYRPWAAAHGLSPTQRLLTPDEARAEEAAAAGRAAAAIERRAALQAIADPAERLLVAVAGEPLFVGGGFHASVDIIGPDEIARIAEVCPGAVRGNKLVVNTTQVVSWFLGHARARDAAKQRTSYSPVHTRKTFFGNWREVTEPSVGAWRLQKPTSFVHRGHESTADVLVLDDGRVYRDLLSGGVSVPVELTAAALHRMAGILGAATYGSPGCPERADS